MLQNAILDRFGGKKPIIPGRDFAGTVVQAPPDPQLVGTEVYGTSGRELSLTRDGTHAEYVVPTDGLAAKPKSLSWTQAGTIGVPYTTAHLMYERAAVDAKDVVLIFGATVITTSRSDGADENVTTDVELKTVLELNSGKGPSAILDCAGSPVLMEKGLAILGRGGRYVFVAGMKGGGPEIKINVMKMLALDQSLSGVNSWNLALPEVKALLTNLGEKFEEGVIKAPSEDILTTIKLEDAASIYLEVAKSEGKEFVISFNTDKL